MARITVSCCIAFGLLIAQDASAQVSSLSQSPGTSKSDPLRPNNASDVVTVSPAKANIRAGDTRRFFATSGSPGAKFVWRVNGVEGGNASTGKINRDGTFVAPTTLPSNIQIEVEAVSLTKRALTGKAFITLLNPTPSIRS